MIGDLADNLSPGDLEELERCKWSRVSEENGGNQVSGERRTVFGGLIERMGYQFTLLNQFGLTQTLLVP